MRFKSDAPNNRDRLDLGVMELDCQVLISLLQRNFNPRVV